MLPQLTQTMHPTPNLSRGSWDDFAAWRAASNQWHKDVAVALQDTNSQEEHHE